MTTLTLGKWGNAQGARVPKDPHEQVGMTDGCRVDASVRDGGIPLTPIHDAVRVIRVPRLSNVFRDRTEEYRASEDPFGTPEGDEPL